MQYGVTVKPDGSFVKKNDKPISNAKAKDWSVYHIKNRVIPFFQYFDERKLTDEEIYMTAMFMYNIGGEQVTGYNLKGLRVGKASKYFEAINQQTEDEVKTTHPGDWLGDFAQHRLFKKHNYCLKGTLPTQSKVFRKLQITETALFLLPLPWINHMTL